MRTLIAYFDTLLVFGLSGRPGHPLLNRRPLCRGHRVEGHDAAHSANLVVVPGRPLHFHFDRDPRAFDEVTIEAIGGRFVQLLEQAVESPDIPLHRLEILSREERHTLLKAPTPRAGRFGDDPAGHVRAAGGADAGGSGSGVRGRVDGVRRA